MYPSKDEVVQLNIKNYLELELEDVKREWFILAREKTQLVKTAVQDKDFNMKDIQSWV